MDRSGGTVAVYMDRDMTVSPDLGVDGKGRHLSATRPFVLAATGQPFSALRQPTNMRR
jgi:hypothetical protein